MTINGTIANPAGRAGNYWGGEALLNNISGPDYRSVSVTGSQVVNGVNLTGSASVNAYAPPASETFSYDADGNLTADGTWTYSYDAENRLTHMQTNPVAIAVGLPGIALDFKYDYLGRRVEKKKYTWSSSSWVLSATTRFMYNGWNLIAELNVDQSNNITLKRSFTWGLDMQGSLTATGGIGALLMIQDNGHSYLPAYDGAGNLTVLLDASNGSRVATYEYDPYGRLLRKEGSYAVANPFRFSTKYWDEETGLVYYGYRYYSPNLGRFINRDPIEESGGLNLYAFVTNNPINFWEYMGHGPIPIGDDAGATGQCLGLGGAVVPCPDDSSNDKPSSNDKAKTVDEPALPAQPVTPTGQQPGDYKVVDGTTQMPPYINNGGAAEAQSADPAVTPPPSLPGEGGGGGSGGGSGGGDKPSPNDPQSDLDKKLKEYNDCMDKALAKYNAELDATVKNYANMLGGRAGAYNSMIDLKIGNAGSEASREIRNGAGIAFLALSAGWAAETFLGAAAEQGVPLTISPITAGRIMTYTSGVAGAVIYSDMTGGDHTSRDASIASVTGAIDTTLLDRGIGKIGPVGLISGAVVGAYDGIEASPSTNFSQYNAALNQTDARFNVSLEHFSRELDSSEQSCAGLLK